jgi:hypothetical protein
MNGEIGDIEMSIHIDFRGQVVFTCERAAAALGLKISFLFMTGRVPQENAIGDSPSFSLFSNDGATVPPHKRGETKLLGGKISE